MHIRHLIGATALLLLAGCASAEQKYCERMATPPGSAEYPKCVRYYFDQTAIYKADRNVCEIEADATYPRALYDYGRTARVYGGFGPYGMHSAQTVDISPDYARNQMVDQLRMRIVEPCMLSMGWRDAYNWEAGKGAPPKRKIQPAAEKQSLPWLKK